MKFLASLAGLAFLGGIAIILAYYFVYFIPYTAESAKYENELLTYRLRLGKCETAHGVKIDTDVDSGEVAGCSKFEQPIKPQLPLANVIRAIGAYVHIPEIEHVGE